MRRIDTFSLHSKIALGTFSQVASRLAVALLSIITLRYSTQYLGADTYGQYATVVAYVTIFALLTDLGLTAICSREIAKAPHDAEKIIGNSLAMRIVLSLLLSPLIVISGWLLYATKPEEVRLGIALMVVTLIMTSAQSVASAFFTAKNRSDIPAVLGVLNKAVYLVAILCTGAIGLGFYGFIYAAIFASVVSALLSAYWAAKRIRLRLKFRFDYWRLMLKTSIPLGIIQIINMLYYKIDSVMLSIMRTPAEVGMYAIAYGIIDVIMSIPSLFMTTLMPTLATVKREELQALVQRAIGILAFCAFPIAVGGILLSRDIILLISSEAFLDAALPFAILAAGAVFSYLSAVFGFASVAINKQAYMLKVSIATAVINVLINLVLIPRYGVAGAATATLTTEAFAFTGIYLVFMRQTGIRIRFTPLVKPFIAALSAIPVFWLIGSFHLPLGAHFVVAGTAIAATYLGASALLKSIPEDLMIVVRRLLPKQRSNR